MNTTTTPVLEAAIRERTGTRYAARVRKEGLLPAVVYGHGQDPVHISVNSKQLNELLHEHAHLLTLTIDGKEESCIVKDVQWDHLGSHLIHVDFARVNLSEEITVELDVTITGEAIGLKTAGAILEHPQTSIEVSCKANNIPQLISVDVSEMQAGDTISVADLKLPQGVTAVTDGEAVIAVIHVMNEVTDEEVGEGDGTEPEVIGRPAKEDEDA